MEKKYELVKDDIIEKYYGHKLYRIRALKDFGVIKKGDLGGYIEKEENLSHEGNCWLYDNVKVYDNAKVYGDAKVYDYAWVFGNAKVFDNAVIYGDAEVYDNAWVFGNARIFGNAEIYDNAEVYGNARVHNNACIYGKAKIYDYAWVFGNAKIASSANIGSYTNISLNALILSNDDHVCINGFGSRNRFTTFYKCVDGSVRVNCGCFNGTLDEFRDQVKKTREGYIAEEYLMIADLMEKRFKNREDKKGGY